MIATLNHCLRRLQFIMAGCLSSKNMQTFMKMGAKLKGGPFSYAPIFMKDAHSPESNEISIFRVMVNIHRKFTILVQKSPYLKN